MHQLVRIFRTDLDAKQLAEADRIMDLTDCEVIPRVSVEIRTNYPDIYYHLDYDSDYACWLIQFYRIL